MVKYRDIFISDQRFDRLAFGPTVTTERLHRISPFSKANKMILTWFTIKYSTDAEMKISF